MNQLLIIALASNVNNLLIVFVATKSMCTLLIVIAYTFFWGGLLRHESACDQRSLLGYLVNRYRY